MTLAPPNRFAAASDAVIPWAIGLIDGLVPLRTRITQEDSVVRICVVQPQWAEVFFAGLLSTLSGTLPADDEYRMLSARFVNAVSDERDLVRGRSPQPPHTTGAVLPDRSPLRGQRLGAAAVADSDLDYAALAAGISDDASALVAFAADGFDVARQAMRMLRESVVIEVGSSPDSPGDPTALSQEIGGRVYSVVDEAVRWLVHRRRYIRDRQPVWVHLGVDEFPRDAAWAWSARADQLMRCDATSALRAEIEEEIRRESLVAEEA